MASHRPYQDVLWVDPVRIAREMVSEIVAGHEKREVSTARFRDQKAEKDAERKKAKESEQQL
jgi:hypothetical protein